MEADLCLLRFKFLQPRLLQSLQFRKLLGPAVQELLLDALRCVFRSPHHGIQVIQVVQTLGPPLFKLVLRPGPGFGAQELDATIASFPVLEQPGLFAAGNKQDRKNLSNLKEMKQILSM